MKSEYAVYAEAGNQLSNGLADEVITAMGYEPGMAPDTLHDALYWEAVMKLSFHGVDYQLTAYELAYALKLKD